MLKNTRQTFIVSDLHFGHANIINYCNRPYTVVKGNRAPENKPALAAMKEDILKMFDFLTAILEKFLMKLLKNFKKLLSE